ncbi:MAG TPA: hypothetical protein VMU45_08500 [Candidatus Eisenbacteria bacterium]|nr:hypothetical protein [Candidatus Eisenbacteria bacterium]
MPYPTCRHVMDDGNFCQSPAMRGQHYCYFHISHRTRYAMIAQERARGERTGLYVPPLKDLGAVQLALTELCKAIAADEMDPKSARTLLSVLRTAADNLKTGQVTTGRRRRAVIVAEPRLSRKYIQ